MKVIGKVWAVSALVALASVSGAQFYRLEDLAAGSPFPDAFAYGVSQNGLITGVGTDPVTSELHAYIWQNGVFQDLGDLGYPYGADGIAINDSGQVAATGYGPGYNALLYTNGVVKKLGSIDGGFSEGLSINSSGDIVGRAINGDGGGQGFSYIGGQFTALSVDRAAAINDSDQFVGSVGYYWTQYGYVHGVEHAFIDDGVTLTELGDIGGGIRTNTEAFGVNNLGQVTGYSTAADGTIHAFLYSGGAMADLGTFAPYYTYGVSINDNGEVVGNIETYVGGQIGMFLYANGSMRNFADVVDSSGAGWGQLTPMHMNNNGWIVGYGTYNGGTHGFLARPYAIDGPTSFDVVIGHYAAGTVDSLQTIDGNDLKVGRGATNNPNDWPVTVVLNGTASHVAPSDVRLSLTSHTNAGGLVQRIEMWDYQASAWVTVGSRYATTTDTTEVAIGKNPGRFVEPGTNAMMARVSWRASSITRLSGWTALIDQAVWNDSP